MLRVFLVSTLLSSASVFSIGRPSFKSAELQHVDPDGNVIDDQTETIDVEHGAFQTCVRAPAGDTLVVTVFREGSDDPCFVDHEDFPDGGEYCYEASACFTGEGGAPNTVVVLFTPPGHGGSTYVGVLSF